MRPMWPFTRASTSSLRCCNSSATDPVQASVSVPLAKRRGTVVPDSSGPTISAQSAITCALPGARLRKAGRVSADTSAPTGRGP